MPFINEKIWELTTNAVHQFKKERPYTTGNPRRDALNLADHQLTYFICFTQIAAVYSEEDRNTSIDVLRLNPPELQDYEIYALASTTLCHVLYFDNSPELIQKATSILLDQLEQPTPFTQIQRAVGQAVFELWQKNEEFRRMVAPDSLGWRIVQFKNNTLEPAA